MKQQNNTHIYVGLGTAFFLVGAAFLFHKIVSKQKKGSKTSSVKIDTSIFDSKDLKGSGKCIDSELVSKLKLLEQKTGYPIFSWINSAVRTDYWNTKVGGVSNSSHKIPKCQAVDIKATNLTIRNNLVTAAREVGFKRIGVGKTFVHLDVDNTKSQYVAWGYPSGAKPAINPFV